MNQQNDSMVAEICQSEETIKKIYQYLFKWSDRIGKGSFSDVYFGINEHNQQTVAIKLIKNESVKSKTAQRLLNHQISILKHLNHPNVIKCHDVLTSLNHCYIVTEYCADGDLEKILKKKKIFVEQQITKIIYDVYKGLQYLNQNLIVHRDLKIANIFLNNDTYKIADFGFAIRAKSLFADIPVGSPIYMSPEGLINNNYGPKTDVWSFGIMIYQLLHGEAPLDKCKTEDQLKMNVLIKPQIKAKISPQLNQFILKCMQTNVLKRISVSQIKQTNFMKKLFAIYEKPQIPQKLTSTYHSTETSLSVSESIFEKTFTDQEALSILHYCRLLHKTSLKTGCKNFALWLLLIFEGFAKCKIVRSQSKKQKSETKSAFENLKQVILEYKQKYKSEHIQIKFEQNQLPSFDSILSECTRLYKEYESKTTMNELKNGVFNLYKETELLKLSFKSNEPGYFAKHSQAKQLLQQLVKSNPVA